MGSNSESGNGDNAKVDLPIITIQLDTPNNIKPGEPQALLTALRIAGGDTTTGDTEVLPKYEEAERNTSRQKPRPVENDFGDVSYAEQILQKQEQWRNEEIEKMYGVSNQTDLKDAKLDYERRLQEYIAKACQFDEPPLTARRLAQMARDERLQDETNFLQRDRVSLSPQTSTELPEDPSIPRETET